MKISKTSKSSIKGSSIQRLSLKELHDEVQETAINYLKEGGFDLNEISDMLFVEEDKIEDGVRVEVRCELSYEGMWNLGELLNPIVAKYDETSYFEQVDAGIMEAIIRTDAIIIGSDATITGANYGGAYDIDPHQYFTRDDLVEFGEHVCEHLNEIFKWNFSLRDVYIVDYNRVVLEVSNTDTGYEYGCSVNVDMRRIRKPSDLKDKYWGHAVYRLREQIESDEGTEGLKEVNAGLQLGENNMEPPEPKGEFSEDDEEITLDVDTYVDVDNDGKLELDYDYVDWSMPDPEDENNDEWKSEADDIFLCYADDMCNYVLKLLRPHMPVMPGRYHVTCKAHIYFKIDGIYVERSNGYIDDQGDAMYDEERYTDGAEAEWVFRRSSIKDFKATKIV